MWNRVVRVRLGDTLGGSCSDRCESVANRLMLAAQLQLYFIILLKFSLSSAFCELPLRLSLTV